MVAVNRDELMQSAERRDRGKEGRKSKPIVCVYNQHAALHRNILGGVKKIMSIKLYAKNYGTLE